MGLGRLEPEARNGPETIEDGLKGHRRSTTDLTLIRRAKKHQNPDKKPSKPLMDSTICRTFPANMPDYAGIYRPNHRPNLL